MNSRQVDNKKDLDVVKPMHNLIEYIDNYSKTSGILDMYQISKFLKVFVITLFLYFKLSL